VRVRIEDEQRTIYLTLRIWTDLHGNESVDPQVEEAAEVQKPGCPAM
jgi:hypothetical protein